MSQNCPLCGKEKRDEALFCDACTKKFRAEYEVEIPVINQRGTSHAPDEVASQSEEIPAIEKTGTSLEETVESLPNADSGEDGARSSHRKTGHRMVRFAVMLLLLFIALFLYNELVRKGNLERSGWETATKTNSVAGYLHYIEKHPDGKHFDDAQSALMRLKSDEATRWEELRLSDRVTELRDFLMQYPQSNYVPLVKRRLDSLSWMGALHSNTAAAYSDYMVMAESGDFNGDYLAEAESRYQLLFQSYPVDPFALDSIRIVVNGFCSALSASDHEGLASLLAPRVGRFFFRGSMLRERLLGEIIVEAARSDKPVVTCIPDLNAVQYEKTMEENYRVNLPIVKSQNHEGVNAQQPGYILHLELNPQFQVLSVHETKPYAGAP